MSNISRFLEGYQINDTVTFKENIENKTLQSIKSINNIKSNSEFIEDIDISFPNLWYMFDNTSILKNYGIKQTNYDTTNVFNIHSDFNKNMNFSGSGITFINKNIINEFEKDFTLSFWFLGTGEIFKISNPNINLITIIVTTNSIIINSKNNETIISDILLTSTDYNHIVITCLNQKVIVYVNGLSKIPYVTIQIFSFNYTDTIKLLDTVKYSDLRIFNKVLSEDKISSLYNIGTNINLYGIELDTTYSYYFKKIKSETCIADLSNKTAITVSFWVNCNNSNKNIISFEGFKCGVYNKRFFIEDIVSNSKIFSNRKIANISDYYFITFVIQNNNLKFSHIIELYVDNYASIGKSLKNLFIFSTFTFSFTTNIIEDLLVYDKVLKNFEILDLYISDVKRKTTFLSDLTIFPNLFADYSKTDNKLYNLNINSLNITYSLKLPESTYGGYKDHINDLVVWYKFEQTPNGKLKNYGKDSSYYGIINNSGIANSELIFSPIGSDKFTILQLENNKLDKFHILDTNDKFLNSGLENIKYTVTPTNNINVDILIVGGGGGGNLSGGGGADIEYIQNYTLYSNIEYTFKVGKGGSTGYIGGFSEILDSKGSLYKVLGGGGGGGGGNIIATSSATSGGGLVLLTPSFSNISPLIPLGKGFKGGRNYYNSNLGVIVTYAGGGGGSGSAGGDATSTNGGKGGSGLFYEITTLNVEYGAGGNSYSGLSTTTYTPPIISLLSDNIIKSANGTLPSIVIDNINEIYYKFTLTETITFQQDLVATVFISNKTNSFYSSNINFIQNKSYVINPINTTIMLDSITITDSLSIVSTISKITGEYINYNTENIIIIRYTRITTYEYGKGGNINTAGNSGAIIIRYNYYDQTKNKERVILQKPGYLNPYSYIWCGNQTQSIDDSSISINNPVGILNNTFLSINFWLERNITTVSKDYIFAITELDPYNEIIGIGVDSSNFFVNILGSSNIIAITTTNPFIHYSVEIDFSNKNLAIYTTNIDADARLNLKTPVIQTIFLSTTFIPTFFLNYSNLYSRDFRATIGDIHDENIIEYELSPNGIEDFRIYNKTLQAIIPNVLPLGIKKYNTLFMTGYTTDISNGITVASTNCNIDLQFYNLTVNDGSILKNIGNLTSNYNAIIHNASYSNQNVITYTLLDDNLNNVLNGRSGFMWNKIENIFENKYYENNIIALYITNLQFTEKDLTINVYFKLKLIQKINKYPLEIINKNNEIIVRMNSSSDLIVSYIINKIKYVKEFLINDLLPNIITTFEILIDKSLNNATLKFNSGISIIANLIPDLKIWYQFEDDKISKNFSISEYSNLSLYVGSNIGFINSLSSNINIEYSSPYTYYTFLPGLHTFRVENEIKLNMLMVGGGGISYSSFQIYPGAGGGEVKFYEDITLKTGNYIVNVGESGFNTSLTSNSTIIYTVLSGNSNMGGNASFNSNANTNISYGYKGGDGYYSSNILTGVITTYSGGGGGMGSKGEDATLNSGGKGGNGIYYSINPYDIAYEYGGGGNSSGNSGEILTFINDININIKANNIFNSTTSSILNNLPKLTTFYNNNDNIIGPFRHNDSLIYTFKYNPSYDNGFGQTEYLINFNKVVTSDLLIIGGGGGGGVSTEGYDSFFNFNVDNKGKGGGGAGLVVFINQAIFNGSYIIKIGKGGNGAINNFFGPITPSTKGFDSSFDTIVANGGGACVLDESNQQLKNGGSGAGGNEHYNDNLQRNKGNANNTEIIYSTGTIYKYGNNGGVGGIDRQLKSDDGGGGGGGGAGEVGNDGGIYLEKGSMGGDGLKEIKEINFNFKEKFGSNIGIFEDDNIYFAGGGSGYNLYYINPNTNVDDPFINEYGSSAIKGGKGGGGFGTTYNYIEVINGIKNTGSGGGSSYSKGGNGGSGIVIMKFLLSYPNYSLYTVLPWYQQQLTNIKDIISFKVWNNTYLNYEKPTNDFIFNNSLLNTNLTPNYTGLYTFIDAIDKYYFYTFKYVTTIPSQTFNYNLYESNNAYYVNKSYDRNGYIEGNNPDINIYTGDTINFNNISKSFLYALQISLNNYVIVSESSKITTYTFSIADIYNYSANNYSNMTGNINVIPRPTNFYSDGIKSIYSLDIKRKVKADILLIGNSKYSIQTNVILLNGNYIIEVGTTDSKIKQLNTDLYTSASITTNSYNSDITGNLLNYSTTNSIAIIRFNKSNITNVLTQFGRGGNAFQIGTPGILVLKTKNSQILSKETNNHPNLQYSYVWSGKTSNLDDKVLVKSISTFTIPTNFTLTFWYYESINNDIKTDIIKITDSLKLSSTTSNLVFTIGSGISNTIEVDRPNKYEWNFYGLLFSSITNIATLYINNILVATKAITIAPSGNNNIILGISSEGIAKIADYRIYDSIDILNIFEQYTSFGKMNILNVFGNQVTEYDNNLKSYLSLNQNNIKTTILNNYGDIIITYKFQGTEDNKYYPIIQFTDYINNTIAPKFEITMKTNKLFISFLFGNTLKEQEYNIDCKNYLKHYSITIKTNKTFEVKENNIILTHSPVELIGLYSFEEIITANNNSFENIVGGTIFSNMNIYNTALTTAIISGENIQNKTEITVDSSNFHYYEIKTSGFMTFTKITKVDIVLVGGGAGGGRSNSVSSQFYGQPGEVNIISAYLQGTYKVNIGLGGTSNMPGLSSTITDILTSSIIYSASGGLSNILYNDIYSNLYTTYNFGKGIDKYSGYGIDIPGSGGNTTLSGKSGILALREYLSTGIYLTEENSEYFIKRTTGYNLPYSYEWSGTQNETLDETYLYTTINSISFLNNDFIISFWCYLNDSEYISLLSIPDNILDINININTLTFILSDGKATALLTKKQIWQQFTFVRKNGSLKIYVNNFNKTILESEPVTNISNSSKILYINKTRTIKNNIIKPIKISDLRIYNNASTFLINKLGTLPKEQYFYIGANQITDIAPSILSEFKINNLGITQPASSQITYNPINIDNNNLTVKNILGNQSSTAYEWSNLIVFDGFNLSSVYMNVNNGGSLINKCYNGFEFSTTYWTKFTTTKNIYEIELSSVNYKILELKHNSNNLLEANFNITDDFTQIITTTLDKELNKDCWYLIAITAGISDKYLSLSIGAYDSNFDGTETSYIGSSVLVPQMFDYNLNINKYINTFKINAKHYGDVKYYNKFINIKDIYNILKTNTYTNTNINILSLTSSSPEVINFISPLTTTILKTSVENTTLIDIHKYYRINISFSFSKNDLELSSNVSDFIIQSDSFTCLKFFASQKPTLKLYSNNEPQTVLTKYTLSSNIWYDFYVTMNYDGKNTTGEIYIGCNNSIDYSINYNIIDFIPFKDIDNTLEIRIGINKDEESRVLNKKIENIYIYTKKIDRYTINNIITNNIIDFTKTITTKKTEKNILELWYLLNDFTGDTFNNSIKDSSGKNNHGIITGNYPILKTHSNKSYILLKNKGKSIKITNSNFNITTPVLVLINDFTIMIKVKLESVDMHNIFTYNDLMVNMSNTNIIIKYKTTTQTITETIPYNFLEKWYAIILVYNNSKLLLYINEILQNKYYSVIITPINNRLILSNNLASSSVIQFILEDLRIFSNSVNYQTIYEYANGLNGNK
jgi:hypothetical protein